MTYFTYSQRLCLLSAAIVAVTFVSSAAAKPQPPPTNEAHAPLDVPLAHGTKVAKPTADPVKNQTFAVHAQMTLIAQANHQRYHESLDNVTPSDAYFGRAQTILKQRERIKRQTIEHRRLQHRKLAA